MFSKQDKKEILQEFNEKNYLLDILFKNKNRISHAEYISKIFQNSRNGNKPNIPFIYSCGSEKKKTYKFIPIQDYDIYKPEIFLSKEVYMPYCSFLKPSYMGRMVQDVHAFVVDIDGYYAKLQGRKYISGKNTLDLLESAYGKELPPSFVVNSGKGIHLVYLLSKPIPHFRQNRDLIQMINRNLNGHFLCFGPDPHPVFQAYRIPGTITKFGEIAQAWDCNKIWDIEDLVEKVHLKLPHPIKYAEDNLPYIPSITPFPPKRKITKVPAQQISAERKTLNRKGRCFYANIKQAIEQSFTIQEGYRNNIIFCLSVAAYKSGIAIDQLSRDAERINHFVFTSPLDTNGLRDALKGYSDKYRKMRWVLFLDMLPESITEQKRRNKEQPDLKYKFNGCFLKYWVAKRVLEIKGKEISIKGLVKESGLARNTVRKLHEKLSKGGMLSEPAYQDTLWVFEAFLTLKNHLNCLGTA